MTTNPRFCISCHAPISPGSEVCANCGAYQYAAQTGTPLPHLQHNEPFQPPSGIRADISLQAAPGQYVLMMPPALAVTPLARPYTSGFAITSLALGVPATILALAHLLFDVRETFLDPESTHAMLALLLILALFCWMPALLAFIFGLLAQRQIRRDKGQMQGLELARAGVALGSIGFALPLVGVLLFALTFLVI